MYRTRSDRYRETCHMIFERSARRTGPPYVEGDRRGRGGAGHRTDRDPRSAPGRRRPRRRRRRPGRVRQDRRPPECRAPGRERAGHPHGRVDRNPSGLAGVQVGTMTHTRDWPMSIDLATSRAADHGPPRSADPPRASCSPAARASWPAARSPHQRRPPSARSARRRPARSATASTSAPTEATTRPIRPAT